MFPLFETVCVKSGVIQYSEWHRRRFFHSFINYYGTKPDWDLFNNIRIAEAFQKGIIKLKISYNQNSCQTKFEHYQSKAINSLRLVKDDAIDYSLKYSDRTRLNQLLQMRRNCDDILIVKNGLITDSLFCNIVFYNGEKWVTPTHPLLPGTARARLLATSIIEEREIAVADLSQFQSFRLINAMRDFDSIRPVSVLRIEG